MIGHLRSVSDERRLFKTSAISVQYNVMDSFVSYQHKIRTNDLILFCLMCYLDQ